MSIYLAILISTLLLLIILGAFETWHHNKTLATIPIRIHVNGTRGKSSVTRLIAAGLRAGGITTIAKTTGTLPRLILPDGKEFPIFRPSKPSISEQMRMVRFAANYRVQAIVFECMALQPWLQWISEARMIKSTLGVITNCRPDHLELMGPTEVDVSKALCGTVPQSGLLLTSEINHIPIIEQACHDRKTQLITIATEAIQNILPTELEKFRYIEHPENIALALSVCEKLGIEPKIALRGMQESEPDPGALQEMKVRFFEKNLIFFNGFAANDPFSTERVWKLAMERYPDTQRKIMVFNCRLDRPERSMQFANALPSWDKPDAIVLMGDGTYVFAKEVIKKGFPFDKLFFADEFTVEEIFELIISLCESKAIIVGMGNIAGQGLSLVQHFKNRSTQEVLA